MNDRYEKERAEVEDFLRDRYSEEIASIRDHLDFLICSIIDGHSREDLGKIASHIKHRLEDLQ